MRSEKFSLAGRVALVTGAGKRIGRALALALADAGAHVVVHYHESRSEAKEVADAITQSGRHAWTLSADLSDADAALGLLRSAIELAGAVDVLVNSASIYPKSRLSDFSEEDLIENLSVNAYGPLVLSRALAAQGRPGRILNLLDSRMIDYDAGHVAYHLSKRMLFALTRMLAVELAPAITVNAIAPGLILPPPGEDDSFLEKWRHTNYMNAWGSLEEITDAALYLLQSGFVTGQVLYVDGGRHMKNAMYGA